MTQQNRQGRLAGKTALLTGGAAGIGAKTAELFIAEGAQVVISDIDEQAAQATADRLGASALQQDVADEARWPEVIEASVKTMGSLSVLVNNAGIGGMNALDQVSTEEWRHVLAVDLDSVFFGCKYALGPLEAQGGSIVNVSSVAGIIAQPNMLSYNVAKAGVRHLTKSVALRCAQKALGVRCNSVHPAFLDTAILDKAAPPGMSRPELLSVLASHNPMKRIGRPEDAAYAILYLASDESAFVNGAELVIDGGLSVG